MEVKSDEFFYTFKMLMQIWNGELRTNTRPQDVNNILLVFREKKLSKEHEIYSNKLKDKKKKFQEELDFTEKQVRMFQNKSNMNEAENFIQELEDIEKKLEMFQEEVRAHC